MQAELPSERSPMAPIAFRFPHDVEGWLTKAEGRRLAALAEGGCVLEVGSWQGRSTVCLAQTAAIVHAVDPHRGIPGIGPASSLAPFLANLTRYALLDKVVVHVGTLMQMEAVLGPHLFDLLFLD